MVNMSKKKQEYDLSVLAGANVLIVFELAMIGDAADRREVGLLVKSPSIDEKLVVLMSEDGFEIMKAKDYDFPKLSIS